MPTFVAAISRTFTLAVQALIVILVVIAVIWLWKTVFWSRNIEFTYTNLVSATESDLLITGIAQVDLIWIKTKRREYKPGELNPAVIGGVLENAKQLCLHSYEVTFGYPSLSAERAQIRDGEPLQKPKITTINTVRSESAPDDATLWCQEMNLHSRRTELDTQLRHVLTLDGVLQQHLIGGKQVLASILDLEKPECIEAPLDNEVCQTFKLMRGLEKFRESSEAQSAFAPEFVEEERTVLKSLVAGIEISKEENAQQQLASEFQANAARALAQADVASKWRAASSALDRGAQMAAVNLTFSTIMGAAQERKQFLGLWKKKRFYLQKDVSHVFYGASLNPDALSGESVWYKPSTTIIELELPHLIAIDRATTFIVARGKVKNQENEQSLSNYLNGEVVRSIDENIKKYHDSAVRMSMDILRRRVRGMVSLQDQFYEIRFRERSSSLPALSILPQVVATQKDARSASNR